MRPHMMASLVSGRVTPHQKVGTNIEFPRGGAARDEMAAAASIWRRPPVTSATIRSSQNLLSCPEPDRRDLVESPPTPGLQG